MKVIFKLAFRNITHAGLRTWLNVFVLSLAFVLIIWTQGLYDGISRDIMRTTINMEIGGGVYWQKEYDPYDPLTLEDAHAPIPESLSELIARDEAAPILIISGSIFPKGRIHNVRVKGIDQGQKVLELPTEKLKEDDNDDAISAFIGAQMAKNTGLKEGDYVTLRWRDVNGVFDAADLKIVHIMNTNVQAVDLGQVWIPLQRLRKMSGMSNQATMIVVSKLLQSIPGDTEQWIFKDHENLLGELKNFIRSKKMSSYMMYILLMSLALLSIFDTQVLAVFRRRKEMGTMMALGMTRMKVIVLFTLEGTMHGFLALIAGAVYGIPLLIYTALNGIALLDVSRQTGMAFSPVLYPVYGFGLVLSTTILLLIAVIIVSYLPIRRVARLKPTDALRGKM